MATPPGLWPCVVQCTLGTPIVETTTAPFVRETVNESPCRFASRMWACRVACCRLIWLPHVQERDHLPISIRVHSAQSTSLSTNYSAFWTQYLVLVAPRRAPSHGSWAWALGFRGIGLDHFTGHFCRNKRWWSTRTLCGTSLMVLYYIQSSTVALTLLEGSLAACCLFFSFFLLRWLI